MSPDGLTAALFAYSPGHMMEGKNGADVILFNHPFTAVPGMPAVIAKSRRFRFAGSGFLLESADRNGFYSPFAYRN